MLSDFPPQEIRVEHRHYSAKHVKEYSIIIDGKKVNKPAQNIVERTPETLVGRKIIKYSIGQGDYGNGSGPGFLGFLLEEDIAQKQKKEWVVITIRGADEYSLLNGKMVNASWDFFKLPKPLIYYEGPKLVDNFGPVVNGSLIKKVSLQDESFVLELEKDGKTHIMEILNKDPRLSPTIKIENRLRVTPEDVVKAKRIPRVAFPPTDHMGNYIIIMEEDGRIYV